VGRVCYWGELAVGRIDCKPSLPVKDVLAQAANYCLVLHSYHSSFRDHWNKVQNWDKFTRLLYLLIQLVRAAYYGRRCQLCRWWLQSDQKWLIVSLRWWIKWRNTS